MRHNDRKEEKVISKPVADYEIFKDKELLDNLRNTIISNLIDDKIPDNKLLHEYINDENGDSDNNDDMNDDYSVNMDEGGEF